jgi:hypothetical protein
MPPIADPYLKRPRATAPDSAEHWLSGSDGPSIRVRVITAVRRTALTRALAHGALPSESAALMLRAAQLTSDRRRRSLARALRRTIIQARKPPLGRTRLNLIRRTAVFEAHDAIDLLAKRVTSPTPVRAEGMAMAELILNNAERSPLYNFSRPGALRRRLRLATAAMDDAPASSRGHEFGLPA